MIDGKRTARAQEDVSSPTKKIHVIAVVLLASTLIGADDCGLSSCGTNADPPPCGQVLIGVGGDTGMGGDTGIGGADDSDTGAGGNGDSGTCMDGSELGTYIRCRGLGPAACEEACFNIGAYCAAGATHPYGSMAGGPGNLKQCQSNTLNHTCTYCFPNGDVCTRTKLKLSPPFWLCSYTGGKGCD